MDQYIQIHHLSSALFALEHALTRKFAFNPIVSEYIGNISMDDISFQFSLNIQKILVYPTQFPITFSKQNGDSELLQIIAKLSLRQEDTLNQMSMDKKFLIFIQMEKVSIHQKKVSIEIECWHQISISANFLLKESRRDH